VVKCATATTRNSIHPDYFYDLNAKANFDLSDNDRFSYVSSYLLLGFRKRRTPIWLGQQGIMVLLNYLSHTKRLHQHTSSRIRESLLNNQTSPD